MGWGGERLNAGLFLSAHNSCPLSSPAPCLVVAVEQVFLVGHGGVALALHLRQLRLALHELVVDGVEVRHLHPLGVGALARRQAVERTRERICVVVVIVNVLLDDVGRRPALERLQLGQLGQQRGVLALLALKVELGYGGVEGWG